MTKTEPDLEACAHALEGQRLALVSHTAVCVVAQGTLDMLMCPCLPEGHATLAAKFADVIIISLEMLNELKRHDVRNPARLIVQFFESSADPEHIPGLTAPELTLLRNIQKDCSARLFEFEEPLQSTSPAKNKKATKTW